MNKFIISKVDSFVVENKSTKPKGNSNLITDLCIGMLLINPNFLDNILDKGRRSRYTHNSRVFISDLKNLITSDNKLKFGKRGDVKFIEDDNIGNMNSYFNKYSQDFDMEKDWSKLSKARDIARNIQKNLIPDYQLSEQSIKYVYWVSPNKEKGEREDIVIETSSGEQYPLITNSKIITNKTQSFNTLLELLLDQQADKLFTDRYLDSWDKLTQEWFKMVYNNCRHDLKIAIDQFIDASRGDSLTYFEYFGITILDPKYQYLGKYVTALDKNYKELSKLLTDIWKHGESCLNNFDGIKLEWEERKKTLLNSKIIEHLMVDSLNNLIGDNEELETDDDGFITAENKVKMRLMKVIVNLLGASNISNYYCSKDELYHIPNRKWLRAHYDDMTVEYNYHQTLSNDENDSQFKIKLKLNGKLLMNMDLFTGFAGGEMSGKLNTKMKIDYVSDWNFKINK